MSITHASNEALLWIIGNVGCQDRVAAARAAVGVGKTDPIFGGAEQGLANDLHASVNESHAYIACIRLRDRLVKLLSWQVPEKSLGLQGGRSSGFLRDVANSEINWITGLLSGERSELGVV